MPSAPLVIVNPVAGGATPAVARTRAQLACDVLAGREAEIVVSEGRGHARELARAAVARGADRVIAWGGDGTVNEVATALAFSPVPLAIVPAGSGNGLARELGIPLRPESALLTALSGRAMAIDVGEMGGRLFVNLAGVGVDAYVAARFNAPGNRRRGFAGYARIAAAAMITYRAGDYVVETAERRTHRRTVLITIANATEWGNGAKIAPDASVNDGLLDVVVITERSRLHTLRQLPRLFNGTVAQVPGCTIERVPSVAIESGEPMPFHVDGEPVDGGTRLEARVHPAALRIIVTPL